jgi:hypothetical protein
MDNFCLLAYIPCIILVVWLFIELRQFMIVSNKLKQTEMIWDRIQNQRNKEKDKRLIQTIPPPPGHSTEYQDYNTDYYYDYNDQSSYEDSNSRSYDSDVKPRRRVKDSRSHIKSRSKNRVKVRRDTQFDNNRSQKYDEFDFESEDISEVDSKIPPVKRDRKKNRQIKVSKRNKTKPPKRRSKPKSNEEEVEWD